MTPQDVAKLIRGPEGSEVCVVVMRCGEKKEFYLRREPIGKMDEMKTVEGDDGLAAGEKKEGNEEELELSESVEEAKDQVRRLSVEDLPVEFKNSDGQHKVQLVESIESAETIPIKNHQASSYQCTEQLIQHQQHFALPTSTPPPKRKSSFSSEQKSQDELDNISTPNSETSDHWELLSTTSLGSTAVLLSISGSISNSLRSVSPSFLANNKFVLAESSGEEYLEHVVLPTDTLQGLCLAYKISATRLRMINGFSGNSLQLAPKKLRIPTPTTKAGIMIRTQDKTSREYKLYAFCAELINMELVEAKAYLDLSNWDLEEALRSAREDDGWNLRGDMGSYEEMDTGVDDCIDAAVRPKALTANDVYAVSRCIVRYQLSALCMFLRGLTFYSLVTGTTTI